MIMGDQEVQWLDVGTGEVRTATAETLVGRYIHRVESDDQGRRFIDLTSMAKAVKVTDWKGWSDLLKIQWYPNEMKVPVTTLTTDHGKTLVGTWGALIPIYDPGSTDRGFHGETKYAHRIVNLGSVAIGDTVRVLHFSDELGNQFDFDTVRSITETERYSHAGYHFTTRSGYMNIGDIYIFAGTEELCDTINRKYDERHRTCQCDGNCTCSETGGCQCHHGT